MVDTYPLTDEGMKTLQQIDDDLKRTEGQTIGEIFLERFNEIGSHQKAWRKMLRSAPMIEDV